MIEVRDLNKTYDRGRNAHRVLRNVSFDLPDTGFVCIVGASGCGKTSLLNAVGGLDAFDNGTISTGTVSVNRYGTRTLERERNNSFGYIFQNYYLLPEHSAAYNVYLGLHALGLSHREKVSRVMEALQAVDMSRYARRAVGQLSGGQQQRVAIARALARRPRVIFADEPTGNLDEENTINICTLLRRISKTSLVVMVTHEENIARFFADRIITLRDGQIVDDDSDWQRSGLTPGMGKRLYTGDYEDVRCEEDAVNLRILREEGAEPVSLTVAVLKDRIVIKLDDGRTVSCGTSGEEPVLVEGPRPVLTLESVDNEPAADGEERFQPDPPARAGSGITPAMVAREARSLLRGNGKGLRRIGAWIFLVVMTVLSCIMVGDYLEVSSIDPKDYVLTDSHILYISLERGPDMPMNAKDGVQGKVGEFLEYLNASGLDFDYIPTVASQLSCSVEIFEQMEGITAPLPRFSYVLLDRLDESDLIYGRMPESRDEVVIDRWVLDQFLEEDGVVQNNITDITEMLGVRLSYLKNTFSPVIVGICDTGDPSLYLTKSAMVSVSPGGVDVMALSELQERVEAGGELWSYGTDSALTGAEQLVLAEDECWMNPEIAGDIYRHRIGQQYKAGNSGLFYIRDAVSGSAIDSAVVVHDDALSAMLQEIVRITARVTIYCEDKQAMKDYLSQPMSENLEGQILIKVTDTNGDAWAKYYADSSLKADARTIVTVTVIALCLVMLYLLQYTQVHSRIGVVAVYRLLGIPGRKLTAIFALECLLLSLISVLPAAVLSWLVVAIFSLMPSLEIALLLPWQAAALVFGGITLYYLLVSLLPVWRLLRLPPARLASKYDM